MLKGCALDPIFATVSYTTEVSTRHFDFPVATSVRVARLAIDRRLSLRGRIKHMNDEVIMDTEFLVANTHYKYIEFFDADELLEQNVRMTATKASTELLREKALELLVRKLDQDVENIVAKRQKRMQMVKDANTAFHSDYSEPSEDQADHTGKHIRWISDANKDHFDDDAEIDGRERESFQSHKRDVR